VGAGREVGEVKNGYWREGPGELFVRTSIFCRGAPACAPSQKGGHMGPPLQGLGREFKKGL
jgi:hypothetical protein